MTKSMKPQGTKYRSVSFVAEKLDLSNRSVRRLIETGELPAFKIGGSVRVSDDDLAQLIARSRVRHVTED